MNEPEIRFQSQTCGMADYRDCIIFWQRHCGQIYEVFINRLSAGLAVDPITFAVGYIDSRSDDQRTT